MKRLVICCDGTWQSLHQGTNPTNIFKLAQAIKPESYKDHEVIEQVVYYDHGVGSGDLTGKVDIGEQISGGAFGRGLDHKFKMPTSSFAKIMFRVMRFIFLDLVEVVPS